MMLSECCGAFPWGELEFGICGDCKEHCDFYDDEAESNNREFSPEQLAVIQRIESEEHE